MRLFKLNIILIKAFEVKEGYVLFLEFIQTEYIKKRLDILKIQLFFIIITDTNIKYAKCLEEYMQIFSGVIFKKLIFFCRWMLEY